MVATYFFYISPFAIKCRHQHQGFDFFQADEVDPIRCDIR